MSGELNERRSQVILEAFEVMDKDKSGAVNTADLKVREAFPSSPAGCACVVVAVAVAFVAAMVVHVAAVVFVAGPLWPYCNDRISCRHVVSWCCHVFRFVHSGAAKPRVN